MNNFLDRNNQLNNKLSRELSNVFLTSGDKRQIKKVPSKK